MKHLVIVESPAKAKTIGKYLGSDFKVIASYGHIRDLPSKDGSVDPKHNFAMVWASEPKNQKHVTEILQAAKNADSIYLATDPDREGEAIAWHIYEVLKEKKALGKKQVYRSVFHEITKNSVQGAIANPRELDQKLVDAYLARRALDYLVGFNLSPVLWRKLPGSKSAGRVQSVALRLIAERELEIEKFIKQEYWTMDGDFATSKKEHISCKLSKWNGEKLEKLSIPDAKAAEKIKHDVEQHDYAVESVETKRVQRHPAAPFITSTLQQEGSRKLGFTASTTMQLAQRLYEGIEIHGEHVGLITYMRTDSVNLNGDAVQACRKYIAGAYGDKYVPEAPRMYKSKVKNAQEAHEAIRPTDFSLTPEKVASFLDPRQLKLYTLIWKRTIACQMGSAQLDQTSIDILSANKKVQWHATGSVIIFDGFLKVYQEGKDDQKVEKDGDGLNLLPAVVVGEKVTLKKVETEQHFTQPPPRFGEASLVKKLEELGIGRPSTYASIIQVLQARQYVRLDNKQFIPEERGRLVTAFLEKFFQQYVQYDFTAKLEDELDDIAEGKITWVKVMQEFWTEFHADIDKAGDIKITDVLDYLDHVLSGHFFPPREDGKDPRKCPDCKDGKLHLKLGKFGAFIGCQNYPECNHTHNMEEVEDDPKHSAPQTKDYPKELGVDPVSQKTVTVRHGPYGFYVQLGEATKSEKPKRATLGKEMKPEDVTFKEALDMLQLPRDVGSHPKTGEMITSSVGRYGPYLKYQDRFISLKDHDVLKVTVAEAAEVIEQYEEGVRNGTIKSRPVYKKKESKAGAKVASGKGPKKGAKKTGTKKKAK